MQKPKLLMIDDDQLSLAIQKKFLKTHLPGVEVLSFTDGRFALDHIEKLETKQFRHISILLDLNMPEISGWEFLEKLKGFSNQHAFLVIVLTSSIDKRDRKQAGNFKFIQGFFEKPLNKDKIEDLKRILFSSMN